MKISNAAGEVVAETKSDAEAAEWWLTQGRSGDHDAETGEYLSEVVANLMPDAEYRVDSDGQVIQVRG